MRYIRLNCEFFVEWHHSYTAKLFAPLKFRKLGWARCMCWKCRYSFVTLQCKRFEKYYALFRFLERLHHLGNLPSSFRVKVMGRLFFPWAFDYFICIPSCRIHSTFLPACRMDSCSRELLFLDERQIYSMGEYADSFGGRLSFICRNPNLKTGRKERLMGLCRWSRQMDYQTQVHKGCPLLRNAGWKCCGSRHWQRKIRIYLPGW